MGFFKKSAAQKEKAGFRKIIAKRNTQAARQAFAEESEKVARERARIKARRPSIGSLLASRVSGSVRAKVSGTTTRRAPIKRRRRTTTRRAPVRRRRRTTTRRAPVRRRRRTTTRRTVARTTTPTQQPINYSEGIFS